MWNAKTLPPLPGSLDGQVVNIDIIQGNTSNAHGKHPSYCQLLGNPVVSGGGVLEVKK